MTKINNVIGLEVRRRLMDIEDLKHLSAEAQQRSLSAEEMARLAELLSRSTKEELDQIVIEGDSSVEAAQARIDAKGEPHTTLKERLDDEYNETHQKIDDNYEEVNDKLAKTEDDIKSMSVISRPRNRKSVFLELPLKFPLFEEIYTQEGSVGTFYPRSLKVMSSEGYVFIQYANTTYKSTWAVVYDLAGNFITTFKFKDSYNTHGFDVYKKEGKLLYVIPDALGETKDIHVYDITVMPENLSTIPIYKTYVHGRADEYIGHNNGEWFLITNDSRNNNPMELLDSDFNYKAIVQIDGKISKSFNRNISYLRTITKGQDLSVGTDFIVYGIGTHAIGSGDNKDLQGFVVTTKDGEYLFSNVYSDIDYISFLNDIGYNAEKVENEGISVDKDNIYTLITYYGQANPDASNAGIVIFEELSRNKDAYDVQGIAKSFSVLNSDFLYGNSLPITQGNFLNPYTNTPLKSIKDVCSFMFDYNVSQLSLYVLPSYDFLNGYGEHVDKSTVYKIEILNENNIRGFEIYGYEYNYFHFNKSGVFTYRTLANNHTEVLTTGRINHGDNYPINILDIDAQRRLLVKVNASGNTARNDVAFGGTLALNTFNFNNNISTNGGIDFYEVDIKVTKNAVEVLRAHVYHIDNEGNTSNRLVNSVDDNVSIIVQLI